MSFQDILKKIKGLMDTDSPIQTFSDQLISNKTTPLKQINNTPETINFGDIDKLPPIVQNIIIDIQQAKTIAEKAAIAHTFANNYIKYVEQDSTNERNITMKELATDPYGDCDDYVFFKSGLLIHGGADPKKLFLTAGINEYYTGQAGTYNRDPHSESPHIFLIVQDEEDKYIILDDGLDNTPYFDPRDPTVNAQYSARYKEYRWEDGKAHYPLIFAIADGNKITTFNLRILEHIMEMPVSQRRLNPEEKEPETEPSENKKQPSNEIDSSAAQPKADTQPSPTDNAAPIPVTKPMF